MPISTSNDPSWDFIRATTPSARDDFPIWETQLLKSVAYTGRRTASPFTRLVEAILDSKDREIKLSFLECGVDGEATGVEDADIWGCAYILSHSNGSSNGASICCSFNTRGPIDRRT